MYVHSINIHLLSVVRVQAFGCLEGQPVSELVEAARRARVKVRQYTPIGGESLEEVDSRLHDFLKSVLRYILDIMYNYYVVYLLLSPLSDISKLEHSKPVPLKEGSLLASSPAPLPPPQWHVLLVGHGGALYSLCEQLRRMPGCELPLHNSSTPNAALTSFLLTLHGQCCHSVKTLTANNTEHLSHFQS